MVDKVVKGKHIRVDIASEIIGKYSIVIMEEEDFAECYLKQKGYPLKYMFGLEKDIRFTDLVAICTRKVTDYWEYD